MRFVSTTLFVVLVFTAADPAIAQAIPFAGQLKVNNGPTITFTDSSVSCTGLSPGDSVALVGFTLDRHAGSQAISTPTILQPADASGVFTTTIKGGVKARSIWLLIDQTTGSYTVAEPQGSVLRQMADGTVTAFKGRPTVGGPEPPATVTINRAHTHLIRVTSAEHVVESRRHVRTLEDAPDLPPPGLSAFDAKDGSASDSDGAIDGVVQLTFPDSLELGDYLFVVDDRTLEFLVLVLNTCNLQQECQ